MKNNAPFLTPNPQEFKLRVVWSIDSVTKMVAEFSNCKWLPRIGETLVLPIDEKRQSNSWRKFKVFDVVYDFHSSTTRVLCSLVKSSTLPDAKTLIQELEKPKDRWDVWEQAMQTTPASKPIEIENDFGLEYQLSQIDTEEDVDECLRALRAELLNPTSAPKPVKNEKYVDEDLESLRKNLDEL
jgi:hypothetical protein